MERRVGVDPHRLLVTVKQGVGAHLISALVDGRISADSPHLVAAALQLPQRALAARQNVAGERHQDHAAAGIHRVLRGPPRPADLRAVWLRREVGPQGEHLLFRRDFHEGQKVAHTLFCVQGPFRVVEPNVVRIAIQQIIDFHVILVPVAADAFFPVLRFILGKTMRERGGMVPSRRGMPGPVVRGKRLVLVEPLAKAGDDFVAGAFEAYDPHHRLGGDDFLDVGQIERRHVADDLGFTALA